MMNDKGWKRTSVMLAPLVGLFAISVLVRLPNINRPLSEHHEWPVADNLITQQIWHQEGGWRHRFLVVKTFPGEANGYIQNSGRMRDVAGTWYYTSLPPFEWLFPYLTFRALGVYPDVLPLQCLSLGLHFLCMLLIYALVGRLLCNGGFLSGQLPALVAATVYLFAPITLWCHSNVYAGACSLILPFFIGAAYVFVRLIETKSRSGIWFICLGLLTFLMAYTYWFGYLFVVGVFLFALRHFRQSIARWTVVSTVAGASVALVLMMAHYSLIAGLGETIQYLADRFVFRTGYSEHADLGLHIYDLQSWQRLLHHYWTGYGFFLLYLLPLLALLAIGLHRSLPTAVRPLDPRWRAALWITLFPGVLQVLVLFNDSAVHDIAAMPMAVPIAISMGLAFSAVTRRFVSGASGRAALGRMGAMLLVFLAVTVLSVRDYQRQNANGHSLYKVIGETIAKTADPDETVFYYGGDALPHLRFYQYWEPFPQIIFYAQRNVAVYRDEPSAQRLLALNGAPRGILFRFYQEDGKVKMEVGRFKAEGP